MLAVYDLTTSKQTMIDLILGACQLGCVSEKLNGGVSSKITSLFFLKPSAICRILVHIVKLFGRDCFPGKVLGVGECCNFEMTEEVCGSQCRASLCCSPQIATVMHSLLAEIFSFKCCKLWSRCSERNALIQQTVPVLWYCASVGWLSYPQQMCCLSVALINVCRCLL